MKDEQNQERYVKEGDENKPEKPTEKPVPEESVVELFEPKVPEPEKPTLEEYYKSKGIDLAYNPQSKAPVKKGEVDAEWIKKEKLTVVATKEELKNQERNTEQAVKHTSGKVGLDIDESDFDKVGFGKKPAPKET